MIFQKDLAPPASDKPPAAETTPDDTGSHEPSAFSKALAAVEMHRTRVSIALGAAMVARLVFEFQFVSLLRSSANLVIQLPYIGLALLSYMLVLMWMSARTRDRFGFGMALGIGVVEATYLIVVAVMHRPFSVGAVWAPLVVAVAHIPMAVLALRAATAYPPLDSKRPWLIGFVTAIVFLAIPWVAPTLLDAINIQ